MFKTVIKKWGNSPSVRLPVCVMQSAELKVDDTVELSVEDGRIIITPIHVHNDSLDTLISGITDENIHEKVGVGKRLGRELI